MSVCIDDSDLASSDVLKQTMSAEGRLFSPGQAFERFRVVAFLGRGATSEVWRVRDESLCADFALKIFMPPKDEDVGNARKRFLAEARLLAQFEDSHIVRVHRLSDNGEHPYYIMDLLRPLESAPSTRTVRKLLLDVLSGLDALHSKGVIHRDIKPSNILAGKGGGAVITDLGIAHICAENMAGKVLPEGERNLTLSKGKVAAIGTPGYGAPEQFDGGDISPATDIHALGMTLLALFGRHPPLLWRALISRMTSSSPILRYSSVAAVRKALVRMRVIIAAWRTAACVSVAALLALVANALKTDWKELDLLMYDRIEPVYDDTGKDIGFRTVYILNDGEHYVLPSHMRSSLRCGPHIWYGTFNGKYEGRLGRSKIEIRGSGVLKCREITGAHVKICAGTTLITSGKCRTDYQLIKTETPPPDATIDDPEYMGYAAYEVEKGGKLIFENGADYPKGLIIYH